VHWKIVHTDPCIYKTNYKKSLKIPQG